MKTAGIEKDRLENRQRTFRKYYEARGLHHEPRYFKQWHNPSDGLDYWVYNGQYFEQDRQKQDWSRLPDIFSDNIPEEVKPFIVGKKS
jgi:hypothetical protein